MSGFKLTTLVLAASLVTNLPAALAGHGGGGGGGHAGHHGGHGHYGYGHYGHYGYGPGIYLGVGFYPGYGYYGDYPLAIAVPPPVAVVPAPVLVSPPAASQAPPLPLQELDQRELPAPDPGLKQLNDPSPSARVEAVMRLGRSRVQSAVPSLIQLLSRDSSAQVREAAARALGLIGSPQALSALQTAGLADDDPEVRHSAQFAIEVVRNNLRGR